MPKDAKRGWLERLGLKAAEAAPDDWVVVARLPVQSQGRSSGAEKMVEKLTEAGIEARAERFVLPDDSASRGWVGDTGPGAQDRVRVAVQTRRRDQARANVVLGRGQAEPVSDEELARLAEQAGPPPPE